MKAAGNRKQKAFQRYKATASQADYKFCRNKAKGIIRRARLNYESQLIPNMKTKPRCFTVI